MPAVDLLSEQVEDGLLFLHELQQIRELWILLGQRSLRFLDCEDILGVMRGGLNAGVKVGTDFLPDDELDFR